MGSEYLLFIKLCIERKKVCPKKQQGLCTYQKKKALQSNNFCPKKQQDLCTCQTLH